MSGGLRRTILPLVLLVAGVGAGLVWQRTSGAAAAAHDFALTDQRGQPFALSSLRGKAVLVFFGYSQCPDVCPTTLSKLTSVSQRLGEQRGDMRVVYVSVDPDRDTPAVLSADLSNFDLDAVGLTGTREEVDRVVQMYGARYVIVPTPESASKYSVSHSTDLYLLDPGGRLRETFPYEATAVEIAEGVRRALTP